jgi:hypothetical protein
MVAYLRAVGGVEEREGLEIVPCARSDPRVLGFVALSSYEPGGIGRA